MDKIIFNNIEFYKIKDFEDYYVSKCGKVLSCNNYNNRCNNILKPRHTIKGYQFITLSDNNRKRKQITIHKLVAKQFITNDNEYHQINHINEIKTDNRVENLEWCTNQYNVSSYYKNMKNSNKIHPLSKKIKQIDINTNYVIKVWNSLRDIQRELGFNNSNISKCCNKYYNQSYGYKWEYF